MSSAAAQEEEPLERNRVWYRAVKIRPQNPGQLTLLVLLLGLFGYLVLPPLAVMVWTSLAPSPELRFGGATLDAYAHILTAPALRGALLGTLKFSLGSTVLAVALGTFVAWLVARTDARLKSLAYVAAFVGFAVPGIVKIIGWILLLGPESGALNALLRSAFGSWATLNIYSLAGMIFVEGLVWMPMVFLLMIGPMRAMDPSLEEAASVSGARPVQVFSRIVRPLLGPALLAVVLLAIIRSVQAFEVPVILGSPAGVDVLTTEIYDDVRNAFVPNYARASAYGTLLVIILAAVLLFYQHATSRASRFQTITGKGYRPHLAKLGNARWAASAFLALTAGAYLLPAAYVCYASFLPRLGNYSDTSVWRSLTLENYRALNNYPSIPASLVNSLLIGTVTAFAVVFLTALATWLMVRTRLVGRRTLDQLISLPLVIPGVVMGLAVLLFYLYVPIPLYGTLGIFVVAFIATYSMYGVRYIQPALLQVHSDLEDTARVSGFRSRTVFSRIVIPLIAPSLAGAWVFVFLHSFRELSVAALLTTGETPVVSTQLLDLLINGNLNILSAFSAIVVVLSATVAAVGYAVGSRFGVQF